MLCILLSCKKESKSYAIFPKRLNRVTVWLSCSTQKPTRGVVAAQPCARPQRRELHTLNVVGVTFWMFHCSKHLWMTVRGTISPNSWKVEQLKRPLTQRMGKTKVLWPYNGVLSVLKRNEVLTCGTAWVNLEDSMLSESSLPQKATYRVIPSVWNVQKRQINP